MTVDLSHYGTFFARRHPGQRWHIVMGINGTYCGLYLGATRNNESNDSRGLRGNICLRCAAAFKSWVGVDVLKEV